MSLEELSHQEVKSKQVLEQANIPLELQPELVSADALFFIAHQDMLGDTIIQSGYFEAVRAGLKVLGRNPEAFFIPRTPFRPLFDDPSGAIRDSDQMESMLARTLLKDRPNQKKVVLDFSSTNGEIITKEVNYSWRDATAFKGLLTTAIFQFDYGHYGAGRYARFAEWVLQLPVGTLPNEIGHPKVFLPPEAPQRFLKLCQQFKIDPHKPHLSVIMEASQDTKKYPLVEYMTALKAVHLERPDCQFLLVTRDFHHQGFEEKDFKREIKKAGLEKVVRIVQTELEDLAILFAHERVVLTNDTGLAHVAAAVPGDRTVVTLFSPQYSPAQWLSSDKQLPLQPAPSQPISTIPPGFVAEATLQAF